MDDHDLPVILADLRREYAAGGLDESDLAPDPLTMFQQWMGDVVAAGVHEPNAMVVATASVGGVPASRMVLLKGLSERGFVFFTNYSSRKGAELTANPACSLLFPWHVLERQVRVEGTAQRLPEADNTTYFQSRPRASQLGAWASPQSQVVRDRAALEQSYAEASARFDDGGIPLPPHWGGFVVAPSAVEFWQGRLGRMHDRLRYRATGAGWAVERLAP